MSGDDHFIKPDNDVVGYQACDGSGEIFRGVGGPDDPERCHVCNGTGSSMVPVNSTVRYDPTVQPYDEPFRHVESDADLLRGMLAIERQVSAERAQEIERLRSLLQRLAACEGGSWHVERYAKERARLLEEVHALAEGRKT